MKRLSHYTMLILSLSLILLGSAGCSDKSKKSEKRKGSVVELRKNSGKYRLFLNGKEFYVKGAGLEFGNMENLAAHGANSFRTWRTNNGKQTAKEVLDEAEKNGLMVLMGIEIGRERHGYDYNDTAWVKAQYNDVKKQVSAIKDHPALLAWAVGNELNLHNTNPKIWAAVNDISKMIHKIDGNHPTTTTFAGFTKEDAENYMKHCTDFDFVSIQMYGDIINLPERLEKSGYQGPYMVTEWGATGHWEMPKTKYGIPIEQTGTEKAASVKKRWEKAISSDKENCLGSYIFVWGQKQERTPTWYGLFTESGKETAVIDVMHEIWNGEKPDNLCPNLDTILLNGQNRFANISLAPKTEYNIKCIAHDPDKDSLSMYIEIITDLPENYRDGGDKEKRPETVFKSEKIPYQNEYTITTPKKNGTYRVFTYISDGNNNVATANVPFYVSDKITAKQ